MAAAVVVVVILLVSSSRPDGCECLCGWLGVYLDGDDLFLRALLPGSNVSSSRQGADMPRHENYHAHTHKHTLTLSHSHPLFVAGQKYAYVSLDALHLYVRGSLRQIFKYFQLTPEPVLAHLPDSCFVPQITYTLRPGISRYHAIRCESMHLDVSEVEYFYHFHSRD